MRYSLLHKTGAVLLTASVSAFFSSLFSAAAAEPVLQEINAVTETSVGFLSDLVKNMPRYLLSLLFAVIVILVGILLIRLGRSLIRKLCAAHEKRHPAPEDPNPNDCDCVTRPSQMRTVQSLILSIFNYVMYFIIIIIVFSALGVDITGLLTVAGVGGIAVGFGCQTLVKDFISGLFLLLDGSVKVGDIVTVNGATGTVEEVAIRTTKLRCTNGNIQVVPNGDIRTVTNFTRDYRCAIVDVTVAHGQDYTRALEILKEEMASFDIGSDLVDEPPVVTGVIASDGRAATIRIECRCRVKDCWTIEREIRLRCLERFRAEGIRP